MNKSYIIKELVPNDELIYSVGDLLESLYDYERDNGMSMSFIEGGGRLWADSIKSMLGRVVIVFVAMHDQNVVGFSNGYIKRLPKYYGNVAVGYWESIMVLPAHQRRGIGEKLVATLVERFKGCNVDIIEVDRLLANENSKRIMEKLGFKAEMIRYRCKL